MDGRRLPDGSSIDDLRERGDYVRRGDSVWGIAPTGEHMRVNERWGLEEHEDGTLSVVAAAPGEMFSIWIDKPRGWHGYLTRGKWVDA